MQLLFITIITYMFFNTALTIYNSLQEERFLYIYTQKKEHYADRNK